MSIDQRPESFLAGKDLMVLVSCPHTHQALAKDLIEVLGIHFVLLSSRLGILGYTGAYYGISGYFG